MWVRLTSFFASCAANRTMLISKQAVTMIDLVAAPDSELSFSSFG